MAGCSLFGIPDPGVDINHYKRVMQELPSRRGTAEAGAYWFQPEDSPSHSASSLLSHFDFNLPLKSFLLSPLSFFFSLTTTK